MRSWTRVMGVLTIVVVLAVIAACVCMWLGVIPVSTRSLPASGLLVIAEAPTAEGAPAAVLALLVRDDGEIQVLDTSLPTTVSGVEVPSVASALGFGGGEAVARALEPQTGLTGVSWVVVPSASWAAVIDRAGGVQVDWPASVTGYARGAFVALQPGGQTLTGAQCVAAAAALPSLDTGDRISAQARLGRAVGTRLASDDAAAVRQLMASGDVASNVWPVAVPFLGVAWW